MKLIVGLGNPGKEYEKTRHNIGFMAVDKYAEKENLTFKEKMGGLYTETIINNEKIIILKPLSYMNLSGIVVKKYVDYYKINIEDIIIIHDDLDMELGKLKLKIGGSSGGHNGIKNISENLNNQNYKHIKLGIGKKNNIDIKDYVLSKFTKDDLEKIDKQNEKIVEIIEKINIITLDKAMSLYNGDIK